MPDIKDAYRKQDPADSPESGSSYKRSLFLFGLFIAGAALLVSAAAFLAPVVLDGPSADTGSVANETSQPAAAGGGTDMGQVSVSFDQSNTSTGYTVDVFLYRVADVDHVTVSVPQTDIHRQVQNVSTVTLDNVSTGQTIHITKTVDGQTTTVATYTVGEGK